MNVAIVYDSRTGTTAGAADRMGQIIRAAGHDCSVIPVGQADAMDVASRADALCIGTWTQGLFFAFQHATGAITRFIDQIEDLRGKQVAVFCTYKTSPGGMLSRMSKQLSNKGGLVTGRFKARGPRPAVGFVAWVNRL